MQFRNNRNKIFKILVLVFLFIASIVAMVFGGINIGKNNKSKGVYGDSYFMSYDINLSKINGDKSKKEQALKQTSEAFAKWLLYRNFNVNNVEYEFIDESKGRIFVERFNVPQIQHKDEDKQQDPYMVALNTFESSRYAIQQYNPAGKNVNKMPDSLKSYTTGKNDAYTSVLNHDELKIETVKKDSRKKLVSNESANNFGVEIDVETSLNIETFNNQKVNSADSETKIEWIVFQDVEILLSKLNYAKYLAYLNNVDTSKLTDKERFAYETLPTNLKTWADASVNTVGTTNAKISIPMNESNLLYFYKQSESSSSSEGDGSTNTTREGVSSGNGNSSLKAIVDEHIKGRITYENYNDWFPGATIIGGDSSNGGDNDNNNGDSNNGDNNNSNNNGGDSNNSGGTSDNKPSSRTIDLRVGTSDVKQISFQIALDENSQKVLIDKFTNMSFSAPLDLGKILPLNETNFSKFPGKAWINKPYLETNAITKMDAYESSMLSLGVAILMIAIIVSIIYRIPGIFGGFAIVASSMFSASLLVILNVNFSMSTIVGLLVGVLIATLSITIFMERIRKSTRDFGSIFDSSVNAMKRSMFTILDMNVISLLMGLGLVFVGKGEIIDFGLVLILTSFITYGSIMLFFILPMYLIQNFEKLWNPATYFMLSNKKGKPISFDRVYKLTKIYRKYVMPSIVGVAIAVLIFGLIIVYTAGVQNSTYYNGGTTVYITHSKDSTQGIDINKIISSLPGTGWKLLWSNDEYTTFIVRQKYSLEKIVNSLSGLGIEKERIMTSINNTSYAIEISKSSINAVFAGYGFILIYGIVRLNVFSTIPLFVAGVLGTTTPIAISYMLWIPIDSLFIYSSILISIVSMLVAFSYISITKTRFLKRQISTFDELTSFIVINMIHMKNILIIMMCSIIVFSGIFLLLASSSMIMLFVYIILGSILSIVFSFLIVPFLYFISLYIRQTYVKNILSRADNIMTRYTKKEVDEQLIDGINKFD